MRRRYVHGPGVDEPLLWYEGSGTGDKRWLHADERGSIVAVTTASGAALALNRYDEYGVPAPGNLGRFGYTGQTGVPELGLWYYKARMYAPQLGRFMQPDPIGYDDGMNLYGYVGGDPVNRVDPLGLEVCDLPEKERPEIKCAPRGVTNHATLLGGGHGGGGSIIGLPMAPLDAGGGGVEVPQNVEGEPVEEARLALPKAIIKWLLRTKPAAKPAPKVVPPPKNWKPPIHGPQAPPTSIPQGWRVREMGPNSNYPNGYWRLEKPVGNGGWQGINPSTGKPGPQWETHIPFP